MISAHPFFLAPAANSVTDWLTPAGSLLSSFTGSSVLVPLKALSRHGRATTYTVVAGSLPPGLRLNPANGVISGIIAANATTNTTSFSFTIAAIDA